MEPPVSGAAASAAGQIQLASPQSMLANASMPGAGFWGCILMRIAQAFPSGVANGFDVCVPDSSVAD
eukprot:15162259-Alexandrium_andersonii.AAC.1